MSSAIFEHNMEALRQRNPDLARMIDSENTNASFTQHEFAKTLYTGTLAARNGQIVPIYADGSSAHSLYNPEREADNFMSSIKGGTFAFFAGIGGGYHIRAFLSRFPESVCMIAESGLESFITLLMLIDISDILSNPRVTVISDCTVDSVSSLLQKTYLPALHGSFCLLPLRSWQTRNALQYGILEKTIHEALERISSDFSVQAHFGRLWLRNCILNLQLAASIQGNFPQFDITKTAVIAAAGPGLEKYFSKMKSDRERMIIFSTDTAWNSLADMGIIPDVLISIDAQSVSACHVMRPFASGMTVILDLCGNPVIARRANECGAKVIFAAGGHPLARYAASFSPLPLLDTSSGTVTVAALDAARSLGFTKTEIPGADFAYTDGKPYARGTYLAHTFGKSACRLAPVELLYSALMFRTPVSRKSSGARITYTTGTLEQYASSLRVYRSIHCWTASDFKLFPASDFLEMYRQALTKLAASGEISGPVLYSILPFAAWYSAKRTEESGQKNMEIVINLALDLIAGYTSKS